MRPAFVYAIPALNQRKAEVLRAAKKELPTQEYRNDKVPSGSQKRTTSVDYERN